MKSDKRALFFTLLFTMVCMVLQAQSLQVEGTVISKSDGEPIIGATVLEKGTTNGTITDFDGKFSLSVKQGAEITISYVGFKSQTLKAKGVLRPEISTISFDFTHFPSSGMGAGPWLGPFFTTHMCSTSCE